MKIPVKKKLSRLVHAIRDQVNILVGRIISILRFSSQNNMEQKKALCWYCKALND